MAKQIVFKLQSDAQTAVTGKDQTITYVSADGTQIVAFQAGKASWSWNIMSATNVTARLRNKVLNAYINVIMNAQTVAEKVEGVKELTV